MSRYTFITEPGQDLVDNAVTCFRSEARFYDRALKIALLDALEDAQRVSDEAGLCWVHMARSYLPTYNRYAVPQLTGSLNILAFAGALCAHFAEHLSEFDQPQLEALRKRLYV